MTELTGESKTEAIRQALLERRSRLWFRVRNCNRGTRIQLGYGPGGV